MSELDQVVKFTCASCKLPFWAKPEDKPRFCPYCEHGVLNCESDTTA